MNAWRFLFRWRGRRGRVRVHLLSVVVAWVGMLLFSFGPGSPWVVMTVVPAVLLYSMESAVREIDASYRRAHDD